VCSARIKIGFSMAKPRRVLGDLTNSIGQSAPVDSLQLLKTEQLLSICDDCAPQDSKGCLSVAPCKSAEPASPPMPLQRKKSATYPCERYGDLGGWIAACGGELMEFWAQSASKGGFRVPCVCQRFSASEPCVSETGFLCPPLVELPLPSCGSLAEPSEVGQREPLRSFDCLADEISDDSYYELACDALREIHKRCERHQISADSVLNKFAPEDRERTLLWLFQVCATVNVDDSVLHSSVLLLDRFLAMQTAPIPNERLQLVTVAIVSISLKFHGDPNDRSKAPKLQEFLVCLGHRQFSVSQIFAMEHEVLLGLQYSVSIPAALDFLDAYLLLYMEHGDMRASQIRCLSKFLLQLSLLDATLHYCHPPELLAAGAVYAALCCLQLEADYRSTLLERVASCYDR